MRRPSIRRLSIALAATTLFLFATVLVPAFADDIVPDIPTPEPTTPVDDVVDDVVDTIDDTVDDVTGSGDDAGDTVDDTVDDTTDGGSDDGGGTDDGGTGGGGTGGGSGNGDGNGSGKGKGGKGGKGDGKDGGYGDLSWWTGMTPTFGMHAFDTRLVYQPFSDATRIVSTDGGELTDVQIAEVGGESATTASLASSSTSAERPFPYWALPLAVLALATIAFALFEPEPGAATARSRRTAAVAGS